MKDKKMILGENYRNITNKRLLTESLQKKCLWQNKRKGKRNMEDIVIEFLVKKGKI